MPKNGHEFLEGMSVTVGIFSILKALLIIGIVFGLVILS